MSLLWSDRFFGGLARRLYERCGLVFEGGQAQLFRRRVERRAEELGHPDATAYLDYLDRMDPVAEFECLVELLTVNETYFFREEEHFHLLLDEFWSRWTRNGRGPIRVWSAACSTGCEPYTLAILLRERGLVGPGRPVVEIVGTDVNSRVLAEAKHGVYGDFSLRNTPDFYRQKYFRQVGHGYRLDPTVREMVTFRKANLLRPERLVSPGEFHAVFCRNVMIYFDLEAKRRVVGMLEKVLHPGGVLFVGRTESLFNIPEAPPLLNAGGILAHGKPEKPTPLGSLR